MKDSFYNFRFLLMFCALWQLSLAACRHQSGSELNLTGGVEDYDKLPTSVGLSPVSTITTMDPTCTGGFITDRLLLTAAHCILQFREFMLQSNAVGIKVVSNAPAFRDTAFLSKEFVLHPDYQRLNPTLQAHNLDEIAAYDLGFIIFPPGSAPPSMIMPIAREAPRVGDEVQLVGWGRDIMRNGTIIFGKRHYGRNKIFQIDAQKKDVIMLKGVYASDGLGDDNNHASINVGDSGGPLFNSRNEAIGVVSYVEEPMVENRNTGTPEDHTKSFYVNLSQQISKAYIEGVIRTYPSQPSVTTHPTSR